MEANYSSAESPNRSTDDEVYELYSPCYYVHIAMNSILKCLGFRLDEYSATPYTITVCTSLSLSCTIKTLAEYSYLIIQEGGKEKKEEDEEAVQSDRSWPFPARSLPGRKPARLPVSTGGGSQVN